MGGDSKSTQKAESVSFEIIKTAKDSLDKDDTKETVREPGNNETKVAKKTNKPHTFSWSSRKPAVFD